MVVVVVGIKSASFLRGLLGTFLSSLFSSLILFIFFHFLLPFGDFFFASSSSIFFALHSLPLSPCPCVLLLISSSKNKSLFTYGI